METFIMKITKHYNFIKIEGENLGNMLNWLPKFSYSKKDKAWIIPDDYYSCLFELLEENFISINDIELDEETINFLKEQEKIKEKDNAIYDLALSHYDFLFPPYDHQKEGIEKLLKNKNIGLFDEQGLGKTFQSIITMDILLRLKKIDKVLIISKKSSLEMWLNEINTFLPHIGHKEIQVINKYCKQRKSIKNNTKNINKAKIVILNYEQLIIRTNNNKKENKILNNIIEYVNNNKTLLIMDESHKIKNKDSKITKLFLSNTFKFTRKIILTGTPIADKPQDAWSQLLFIDAPVGNYYKFMNEFTIEYFVNNRVMLEYKNLDKLALLIEKYGIRRLKTDCLDLPEKIYQKVYVYLDDKQRKLYETVKNEIRLLIIKDGKLNSINTTVALQKLLRLMQIASNPAILTEGFKTSEAIKIKELENIIQENPNEKIIVWTTYRKNIEELMKHFKRFNPVTIHGGVKSEERTKIVKDFQENDNVKLLFCTWAASEALTLTASSLMVYMDRNWTLTNWTQSQDRNHRIGQTKNCIIKILIASDTIDEIIDKRLDKKLSIASGIQGDNEDVNLKDILSILE